MPYCPLRNAELRISVYGRNPMEWDQLAAWVVDHRLHSPNNRWLVQIPRLFQLFQQTGSLQTFEQRAARLKRRPSAAWPPVHRLAPLCICILPLVRAATTQSPFIYACGPAPPPTHSAHPFRQSAGGGRCL